MTSLYLVRHGETDWNAQRRIQGSTDIPLNEMGWLQAETTGRLLARREWDGVFTSPLSRAYDTASVIAREIGMPAPKVVDGIVERNYGAAEGLDWNEIEAQFPGDAPVPGRETHAEVAARAIPALISLAKANPSTSLVVVSHGGVIRSVLNAVAPSDSHGPITNGSVHSFEYVDGALELIEFNDPIDELSLEYGTEDLDEQNAVESRDALHA
ncbi:MAG: histidine phosphatase family protein [Glaciihabitans sp.]|jgi:probable phosphoglycerate mutase|nr:histidine phosphatase family protein [Glaciihabitans sp.]MDQ1570525.1 putative phosphatase [Actinomycetota bacterium]